MPARRTWTDTDLVAAVAASISMAGVMRRLGLRINGTGYRQIHRHIVRLELDTSHLGGQGWNRGGFHSAAARQANLLPSLRKGVDKVKDLRNRLIASGLKEARCEECGISEWCGQPAPLQVDHVDGDGRNNELENLRILCANCHMLTETWGFKGGRRRPAHALVAELR
ncbi:MAG TPA: HNH endonuclease signature motif containing protein [Micromonosporaceae bacterium]|nr:HNH endonuclease signature motif containing protein [Micromonosporaceae bacterium]